MEVLSGMLLINRISLLKNSSHGHVITRSNAKGVILSVWFCDVAEPVYLPTAPEVHGWVPVPLPIALAARQDCNTGTGTHWPHSNLALQGAEATKSSLQKLKIASGWAGWAPSLPMPVSTEARDQGNWIRQWFDELSCTLKPPLQHDLAAELDHGKTCSASQRAETDDRKQMCSELSCRVAAYAAVARCSAGPQMFHQPGMKSQVKVSPGNTKQAAGRRAWADCTSIKEHIF